MTPALHRTLLALLLPMTILPAHGASAPAPRAHVAEGTLHGVHEADGLLTFKGVPYAAAPTGARRWTAPQPAPHWKGARNADRFGPRCMQLPLFSDMVFRSNGMSEDCLYLNVWTPATHGKDKLPVLVYFYGGGFQAGDGSEPRYDGASMAKQGIVAVTVNYRLGVFGFFAHPELAKESPHKASGNYGLLDQAAALQWVKKNIAAFGGDPGRVTIAGESAGSFSVSAQMISPLAKDTIAGAIGESGSLLGLMALPALKEAEANGQRFAQAAGAPTLKQLRALSGEALLAASGKPYAGRFWVNIDGYMLPEAPLAMYAAGKQAKVPLLAGWNAQESDARSVLGEGPVTEETFMAALHKLYGERAADARRAYAGDIETAARELGSDRFIGYGTWKWLDLHARTSGQPTWRYYYIHPRPGAPGATHSAEIEYAMGNLDGNKVYAWTPKDREVSRVMQAYFANFIKTGKPDGAGLPAWPPLTADRGAANGTPVMVLEAPPHTEPSFDGAHHTFHDSPQAGGQPR